MSKTVSVCSYSYGPNPYTEIETHCKKHGKKVLVLGGKTALDKAYDKIEANCSYADLTKHVVEGECSDEAVERLQEQFPADEVDIVFAVGGGKVIDLGKIYAGSIQKPVATFPTVAATCAATVPNTVVYHEDGSFKRHYNEGVLPVHCFLDIEIIADSPLRCTKAGVADAIAKYLESGVSSYLLPVDFETAMAKKILKLNIEDLIETSKELMLHDQKLPYEKMENVVLNNIVTTGWASRLLDPRFGGHMAHATYNSLTAVPEVQDNFLHGETIAYGSLLFLFISREYDLLKTLLEFYGKSGLPICLADLGIQDIDINWLAQRINSLDEVRVSPYLVTEERVAEGIVEYEEFLKNLDETNIDLVR